MVDAGWALQKAVYAHLTTDPGVIAALGGAKVYDHVPRRTPKPYVTFGPGLVRDWSTSTDQGHEHELTLSVWTAAKGRKEATAVIDSLSSALHDRELPLGGHRLINLRHTATDIRRSDDGETIEGIVRFRATTEVI